MKIKSNLEVTETKFIVYLHSYYIIAFNYIAFCFNRATYNALEEQLVCIDQELANKNHSLQTDLQCLDLRNRLMTGDRALPLTQTDRNIVLTRMQDEIPPE